jgi:hypothetical protein
MADDILRAVQTAWDKISDLPAIDFTEEEAREIFAGIRQQLQPPPPGMLRAALANGFCVSQSAGHPNPAERSFRLIFSFGNLADLQEAHRIYVEGQRNG